MHRVRRLSLVILLVAAAAACGRDDNNNSGGENTTAAAAATTAATTATTASGGTETTTADTGGTATTTADIKAKCASEPLQATEVGITPTDITIEVMADVGSPLAPGLFQGSIDGVQAWAKTVNANGGVGCRQIKVRTWDSKLTPDDTTNGTIDACQNSVAMVGSTALFTVDPSNLATCKDKAGKATGVPDIAERAVEIAHQCNPTTFSISTIPGACPYSGGVRKSNEFVAPYAYYKSIEPGVHGIFLLPGDLPGTLAGSLMNVNAIAMSGNIINDGAFKVSGSDTQASYARFIQTIKDKKSTFAQSGSNDVSMVKLRKEAKAQGVNTVKIWACSLACYTPTFLQQGGADVEGTYLWTQFVPLEEADAVPELQKYIDAVGGLPKTTSWGIGAWSSGLAFQQVVDNIVATDGPNAITREKILDGLKQMKTDGTFNANGIYGEKLTLSGPGTCFMMMQVQNGKFVRVFPEERGKLSCPDNPTFEINLDPSKLSAN